MQPLRDYQQRATSAVFARYDAGIRRVLLVSPTGSGKTRMGEEIALRFERVVWFAHRRELLADAAARLRAALGPLEVGVIAPGVSPSPYSRVQVATVQTALARDVRPSAELVVFDECHHFCSDDWSKLAEAYPLAKFLLLTATPERQDGRGLDTIADEMIVAASYSELLSANHLCPVRVYRPTQILGDGLAQDPTDAWLKYSGGACGFAFFASVDMAYAAEHKMNSRGIRAAVIEQKTPKPDRMLLLQRMRDGDIDCICNVQTMTEGVDVPRAAVCMLASSCRHCGGYLQRAGRVLRPHEEKTAAVLIDLVGASILHGLPTEDRSYSLVGDPIKRTCVVPLKNCPACGAVINSAYVDCPECQWHFEAQRERKGPKIYSLELVEVYAGKDTPVDAKRREYQRLRTMQRTNKYPFYWVIKQYKELFNEPLVIHDATNEEKRTEFAKLRAVGMKRGAKPNFAKVMFKNLFGHWPSDSFKNAVRVNG